jgi:hypothetical protein
MENGQGVYNGVPDNACKSRQFGLLQQADMYSIEGGIGDHYYRVWLSLVVLGRSGYSSDLAPVRQYFGHAIFINTSTVEAIWGV